MTKKRLNWRKIWKEFYDWYNVRSEGSCAWNRQMRVIADLVESDRNEKPEERKRKTVK